MATPERPLLRGAAARASRAQMPFARAAAAGLSAALVAIPLSIGLGIFALLPLAAAGSSENVDRLLALGAQSGLLSVAFGTITLLAFSLLPRRGPLLVIAPGSILAFLVGAATAQAIGELAASPALALACLALLTAAAGALQVLFGWLRLGNVAKYVPHPVTAGFQNAAALLLALGQVTMITGTALGEWLAHPAQALAAAPPLALLVGLVSLLACMACSRVVPALPTIPIGMLAGTLAHHLLALGGAAHALGPTVLSTGAGHTQAGEAPLQGALSIASVLQASPQLWQALPALALAALPVAIIASLDTLLSAKAIENAGRRRMNSNGLLLSVGSANLFGGIAGAVPSTINLASNFAALRAGGLNAVGLAVSAAIALATLAASGVLLSLLPRAAVAGALLWMSWYVLDRWTLQSLPRLLARGSAGRGRLGLDFVVIALVTMATIAFDVLVAVGIGLLIAVLFFVFRMSGNIVRRGYDASQIGSRKARPARITRLLGEHGSRIRILELEGAMFFGTAEQLVALLERARRLGVSCVVIDLARVTEIDSTAGRLLAHEATLLAHAGVQVALCGLAGRDSVRHSLARTGVLDVIETATLECDVDRAIEWAEDQLIMAHLSSIGEPLELEFERMDLFRDLDADAAAALRARMQRREYAAGEVVFREGDPGAALYVIARGSASVRLAIDRGDELARERLGSPALDRGAGEDHVRMVTFAPGTVFGELSLLDRERRSATVSADEPLVCYCLDAAALERLRLEHPEVALTVLRNVSRALVERLRNTTRAIAHLSA